MSTELILSELRDQATRLSNIETAMVTLARQDEKIITMQQQLGILFTKDDLAFNPKDGVVTEMRSFQKSCPREEIVRTVNRQWAAIGLLATITTGSLLKAFGIFQ